MLISQHPLCLDRSEPTGEAAPSNSRPSNKQSARERQPISWHAWAKDAKPDDTAQQEPERPRRSRERSPAQHQRRATDRHDSMRPIMPRASDATTLDRSLQTLPCQGCCWIATCTLLSCIDPKCFVYMVVAGTSDCHDNPIAESVFACIWSTIKFVHALLCSECAFVSMQSSVSLKSGTCTGLKACAVINCHLTAVSSHLVSF